jgi:hypothetical protein
VLQPTNTLQQAGLTDASTVTVVRIELVAEGWKVGGWGLALADTLSPMVERRARASLWQL